MSSSMPQSSASIPLSEKKAACLECRRNKIKCARNADALVCNKCQQVGLECVIPEYHIGRYKGVKNKRSGLEKAIYQVEQAVKRSKRNGTSLDADSEADLQKLIHNSHEIGTSGARRTSKKHNNDTIDNSAHLTSDLNVSEPTGDSELQENILATAEQLEKGDEIALNNAENPLQLLAMASSLPNQSPSAKISVTRSSPSRLGIDGVDSDDVELQRFFGPLQPKLDNSVDVDPIELGLVTDEEAEILFNYFYDHLAHTRWGLDPVLHTASFVRSRSAFLFTSILAASATFLANAVALAKRLVTHRSTLARKVIMERFRSAEIVLAFVIHIPWMSPTDHWADDQACAYLSAAMNIALDLSLNKIVVPSSTVRPSGFLDHIAKSDCIEAPRALRLDGFPDVDPDSPFGRRLLHSRERVWLALFLLDRGVCLARGRPYTVPAGPLVDSCDEWHVSDIADRWDGSFVSMVVLRRDLVVLIADLRAVCNRGSENAAGAFTEAKFLKEKVDLFFDRWYNNWSFQIKDKDDQLPPYNEIIISHTRLTIYCSLVNYPAASSDVKQFFRAAGLASAMDVLRAAVDGESRLNSMPNNTAIMVSFAACFAMSLSMTTAEKTFSLAPNARALIENTASVLERIGTSTQHRNGISALFGRHIRRILKMSFPAPPLNDLPVQSDLSSNQTNFNPGTSDSTVAQLATSGTSLISPSQSAYPYASDMTDDQIIEAINNTDTSQELFQLDETTFLDWLDWPSVI